MKKAVSESNLVKKVDAQKVIKSEPNLATVGSIWDDSRIIRNPISVFDNVNSTQSSLSSLWRQLIGVPDELLNSADSGFDEPRV